MKKDSRVKIFLDSVEVPLKLGIYEHEQGVSQRVIVDVAVFADAKGYLGGVHVGNIIDYDTYYNEIRSWAGRSQVQLIEDYLKELMALCFRHELVQACRVSIRKLDIYGPDQGAGVEVFMTRTEYESKQ